MRNPITMEKVRFYAALRDLNRRQGVGRLPESTNGIPSSTERGKQKLSVNLTDEAAKVVRELAEEQGITVSEVVRRAISLERFVLTQLKTGASFYLERGEGSPVERVHFVFG